MKRNSKYKRIRVGTYIIVSNEADSKHIVAFKDGNGKFKITKIKSDVKEGFLEEKRIRKKQRNEYDRHREHSYLSEYKLNERTINKSKDVEEEYIENEGIRKIMREIWELPSPQNRRVYMRIIDGFSLTEIAKIEKRSIPTVKQSIELGMEKLQKKLKKFYDLT